MEKPQISFSEGQLLITFKGQTDFDHDGKPSAELESSLKLNAAEIVSEVAKKDLPWLEALVAQLKG